jgi:hypothetical protein
MGSALSGERRRKINRLCPFPLSWKRGGRFETIGRLFFFYNVMGFLFFGGL